ncbi:subtilisin family serine protease [Actinopolyspora biskrensis]|uniref:Subtilisin family serine protease n=1 Tax=Actinopolyspora biskrensis TaxID=1470178 RepID=A0A852YZK9_9ACTN|nr:S8 family serine peptidase [Actinopolyspora biskrensis]NYH78969.1 subtilisin family serine protease [Actinopolyspora biskrensis]
MQGHQRSRRRVVGACTLAGATALATFAMGGTAVGQQSDTGKIRGFGGPGAISDSYVVVFEDSAVSAQSVGTTARSLAAQYDASIRSTYDTALRGFSARMSEQQARELATEPGIAYVEQDAMAHELDTQNSPTWGLDRSDQPELPLDDTYSYPDSAGSGVTSYVIDTGVRMSHNEFEGRAESGYDFVDDDPDASDCQGHGTHVAGTIGGKTYGMAKETTLVGVRVLGCDGTGAWSQIISGVDWVAENAQGPAVANMSIGGSTNTSVNDAVKGAIESGVTFAVAAGNSGENACNSSPASVENAITVGASNASDERSTWPSIPGSESNYGRCLDVFAPGTNVTSASDSSDSASVSKNGTSMASPHVAGAAALHLAENPNAGPQRVHDALVNNASSDELTGIKRGSPNKLLNVSYLGDGGGNPDPDPGNHDPSASFTSSCGFDGCAFDAGDSTDPDGDISQYHWDFGDGKTGNGVTVNHSYPAKQGSYTVELTVTDSKDNSDSTTRALDCWNFGDSAYCSPS